MQILPRNSDNNSRIGRAAYTGASTITPELVSVEPGETTSKVNLRFTLGGCVDSLGDVVYDVKRDPKSNKTVLSVAGTNLHNQASMVSFCIAMPTAFRSLELPGRLTAADVSVQGLQLLTEANHAV